MTSYSPITIWRPSIFGQTDPVVLFRPYALYVPVFDCLIKAQVKQALTILLPQEQQTMTDYLSFICGRPKSVLSLAYIKYYGQNTMIACHWVMNTS